MTVPIYFPELNGDEGVQGILTKTVTPYTNVLGDYFYVLLVFVLFFGLYQKSTNPKTLGIMALLSMGFLIALLPAEMMVYLYLFAALALIAVFSKFIKA